ncbi:hypothetical protein B0T10DRAFT_453530 [Thelonectria olida]|uniref:Uncharacterized protein n=1 Tax=Thelonectria olida TaxID=1576542 RepID=A0A9P9AW03_9HYPO|nr:hypothetical protein B0T10DRAFT_453530 [Thelonectria olida]
MGFSLFEHFRQVATADRLPNCSITATVKPGTKIYMPPAYNRTYTLRTSDDCFPLESSAVNQLREDDVVLYNPWVGPECVNKIAAPAGATVPRGTTERYGRSGVNTRLGTSAETYSDKLIVGNAYCIGPNHDWKVPFPVRTQVTTTITIRDGYMWPVKTA